MGQSESENIWTHRVDYTKDVVPPFSDILDHIGDIRNEYINISIQATLVIFWTP